MDGGGDGKSNEELWREVAELTGRVQALEAALRPVDAVQLSPIAQAGARPAGNPQQNARLGAVTAPGIGASESVAEGKGRASALETQIGARLFNRVGIFAILAAAAWFLKLAIDRAWVGPGLRVIIGLMVAAALIVWSERFRRGGAITFSYSLKALASGIAYLSLWASSNLYHLVPSWTVFIAMGAVTLTNAILAWRQESELLAVLALAGGLATPELLPIGGDQQGFLFSYLLLLDVGALTLAAIRPWTGTVLGAFAGTTAYLASWLIRYQNGGAPSLTLGFIAVFFALFTAAPFLALRKAGAGRDFAVGLMTGLPVIIGIFAFIEAYYLLSSANGSAHGPWIAVVLGLAYLVLTRFGDAGKEEGRSANLRAVHLALTVGFAALAALLKFHGYGIALCWIAELAALAAAGYELREHGLARALRGNCSALLVLSFVALLLLRGYDRQPADTEAFLNAHFATYLAGLAVFAGTVLVSRRALDAEAHRGLSLAGMRLDGWEFLAGIAIVAFNLIAVTAVSLQIGLYWRQQLPPTLRSFGSFHRPAYVDLTYSGWFMLYGGVLMSAGFLRRSAFLRWQALILLTLSIGKVFLFDTSHLTEGYRVASFLGLGVLLLAVSFVYQRDLLGLRGSRQDASSE